MCSCNCLKVFLPQKWIKLCPLLLVDRDLAFSLQGPAITFRINLTCERGTSGWTGGRFFLKGPFIFCFRIYSNLLPAKLKYINKHALGKSLVSFTFWSSWGFDLMLFKPPLTRQFLKIVLNLIALTRGYFGALVLRLIFVPIKF